MDSRKSGRRIVYAIGLITLCLAVCGPLVWYAIQVRRSTHKWRHQYDNMTVAQLQQLTELSFPPSTEILQHSTRGGFLRGEVRVKIAMTREDADSFVAQIREYVRQPQFSGKPVRPEISTEADLVASSLGVHPPPDWWQPGSLKKYVAASFPGDLLIVFVGLDQGSKSVVYVLWSTY